MPHIFVERAQSSVLKFLGTADTRAEALFLLGQCHPEEAPTVVVSVVCQKLLFRLMELMTAQHLKTIKAVTALEQPRRQITMTQKTKKVIYHSAGSTVKGLLRIGFMYRHNVWWNTVTQVTKQFFIAGTSAAPPVDDACQVPMQPNPHQVNSSVSDLYASVCALVFQMVSDQEIASYNRKLPLAERKVMTSNTPGDIIPRADHLVTGARKAIAAAGKLQRELCPNDRWKVSETALAQLKKDLANLPYHVLGRHGNCDERYCKRKDKGEQDLVEEAGTVFKAMCEQVEQKLLVHAASLVFNENTNDCERYMTKVAKMNGHKGVDNSRDGLSSTLSRSSNCEEDDNVLISDLHSLLFVSDSDDEPPEQPGSTSDLTGIS
ncbi:uncharacterized protein LOC117639723 [Thrips palmi]|uniref:Uncharacterized protein LOC117639723 n=1 Tax=Thrips palmi TaxID=161013 RepID=A0A6P8Y4W2_THRPL|nr:uncharacterized protein LOC117639723 [Thrips palmi]